MELLESLLKGFGLLVVMVVGLIALLTISLARSERRDAQEERQRLLERQNSDKAHRERVSFYRRQKIDFDHLDRCLLVLIFEKSGRSSDGIVSAFECVHDATVRDRLKAIKKLNLVDDSSGHFYVTEEGAELVRQNYAGLLDDIDDIFKLVFPEVKYQS